MLRWWKRRRLRRQALEADAEHWVERHGPYARRLARMRSIDAYLLGDLNEQERWGQIRESIAEQEPPELPLLTFPDSPDRIRDS